MLDFVFSLSSFNIYRAVNVF